MSIKAVLFDLDGTLLPMDQDLFIKLYFGNMAKKMYKYGYDPDKLIKSIWDCTGRMMMNDGRDTNENVFWQTFSKVYPKKDVYRDIDLFNEYYVNEFSGAQRATSLNPDSKKIVDFLKEKNVKLVLATSPLFPQIATYTRIGWAGLSPEDFSLVTTYENCKHSKPNPDYYREVLEMSGLLPEECIMVGNDVDEDMIAQTLGIKVFLLTDCLLNKKDKDISAYPNGNFDALLSFLKENI